ncbi:hypothetical protein LLG39_07560 [bacterium]|nr:hypothetical protein [bacterium]
MSGIRTIITLILAVLAYSPCLAEPLPYQADQAALQEAFKDANIVDLRTSKVSSVVSLRDVVKIPAPNEQVFVKIFKRNALPDVLKPYLEDPQISGVTICNKYIAIIDTEFGAEYDDVLKHELVHAYISMAAPGPLPFWFQEGSAVHFSTDKAKKFYGQPSKDQVGVMIGKTVEISDTYKQKLQSFHFLIEKVGNKKFSQWYKNAVMTGVVDPRSLLGIDSEEPMKPVAKKRPFPLWIAGFIAVVIIGVVVAGFYAARREQEYQ